MERKELLHKINLMTEELTKLLSSTSKTELNTVPFEGSWTAGQLAKHVIKSNSGFWVSSVKSPSDIPSGAKMLNGSVDDSPRKPDGLVEKIKSDLLNFNSKLQSPEFVQPEKIDYNEEDLLSSLAALNSKLIKSVQSLDLSKTCSAFELPVYGFLTRLEAVHFVIYHTQRHIHQLKNIIASLNQ